MGAGPACTHVHAGSDAHTIQPTLRFLRGNGIRAILDYAAGAWGVGRVWRGQGMVWAGCGQDKACCRCVWCGRGSLPVRVAWARLKGAGRGGLRGGQMGHRFWTLGLRGWLGNLRLPPAVGPSLAPTGPGLRPPINDAAALPAGWVGFTHVPSGVGGGRRG